MSAAIWLIMYDVGAGNEARYLDWFHSVHIPEKLARPGYTWAAHYEVIGPDGGARSLAGGGLSQEQRGFVAFFGGEDTRTFLNPSPAQIKPTQPPLTREMMGLRIGSQMLIAAEEWRMESESGDAPTYDFLSVAISETSDNDKDYGAWCVQELAPRIAKSAGFEVATKLISVASAAKHIAVASFGSLEQMRAATEGGFDDDWSKRVAAYQVHAPGSPLLGRRIA